MYTVDEQLSSQLLIGMGKYLGQQDHMDRQGQGCPNKQVSCVPAFTLIELLMVMALLTVAAAMVVPMMSSASGVQAHAGADMIGADLEYAKSMAISRGVTHSVVFNSSANSYQLKDLGGNVLAHPTKKGFNYEVDFDTDSRLDRVDLVSASFDGTSTIKFDYLGSPYNGNGTPLNSGSIQVSTGVTSCTITIEPVTGNVVVNK